MESTQAMVTRAVKVNLCSDVARRHPHVLSLSGILTHSRLLADFSFTFEFFLSFC